MTKDKIVEGVFGESNHLFYRFYTNAISYTYQISQQAINKPQGISSAQVLRDCQQHFNPSKLFAPWIAAEQAKRSAENPNQRKRRRDKRAQQVKIGHGGTLDPLATGVLIAGVGKGTKQLQGFLDCTKAYEAVVLFGAATDTYDTEGKVLGRAPYEHITREKVEKAMEAFRGKIMQRPPIFSALRVQGKRLYEYAREGKEAPIEIQERPVEVLDLKITEWMEGGMHGYRWPTGEADSEVKVVAEKVLHLGAKETEDASEAIPEGHDTGETLTGTKRKSQVNEESDLVSKKRRDSPNIQHKDELFMANDSIPNNHAESPEKVMTGALAPPKSPAEPIITSQKTSPNFDEISTKPEKVQSTPPAIRLSMTVTSGFYVRSLCHDLGKALGSLAIMSALVRTRQGEFEVDKNVLEYEDLDKGEDVWGEKVRAMLEEWGRKQRGDVEREAGVGGEDKGQAEEDKS
ncbi:MAG: hypothetical protein M1827_001490 [Pycnora praestabilis]|nr:MAG: hypothetical protein M1827_001490 [Pycnora praestabilis]